MKTKFSIPRETLADAATPRPRWLVVDDTEAVLQLMATLLERLGAAEVCQAHSAAEALAQFAAAPERFTFVVTDFDMPGMNGGELCQRLHALAPRLPILLATGSSEITPAGARQLGFCGLLLKPFPVG
jgi:CheY-like chemotaxis protein